MKRMVALLTILTLVLSGCRSGSEDAAGERIMNYFEEHYGEGYSIGEVNYNYLKGCYDTNVKSAEFEADFAQAAENLPDNLRVDDSRFVIEAMLCGDEIYIEKRLKVEIVDHDDSVALEESRAVPREIRNIIIEPLNDKYDLDVWSIVYTDINGLFELSSDSYFSELLRSDLFDEIEFKDAGFERFTREFLDLNDDPVLRKDIIRVDDLDAFILLQQDPSINIESLEDIKWFSNLECVLIFDLPVSVDLSYFSDMEKLDYIIITNVASLTGDLSDLSGLRKLESLEISGEGITGNLGSLGEIDNLSSIIISNAPITGDLSDIGGLDSIGVLKLRNTEITGDISFLSRYKSLQDIDLSNTQVGGDICSLKDLHELTDLYLANTDVYGDSDCLDDLTDYDYSGSQIK